MENDKTCIMCELEIRDYKQYPPPENTDICENCYITVLTQDVEED